VSHTSMAQVVITSNDKEEKVKEKNREPRELDGSTGVKAMLNWSYTMRKLSENIAPFGDSLGNRATETNRNCWSYGIAVVNKLSSYLRWTGGISYLRNGENYAYEDTELDSVFTSQTTYGYISLPLQLEYTTGKKICFYAGIGVVPQVFSRYRQEQKWKVGEASEQTQTLRVKPGYAPTMFVLSATANVGIQLQMGTGFSIFLEPQLRWQLGSSYNKQDEYIHKNRSYGFNVGIVQNL
jgi:hypothetical protein